MNTPLLDQTGVLYPNGVSSHSPGLRATRATLGFLNTTQSLTPTGLHLICDSQMCNPFRVILSLRSVTQGSTTSRATLGYEMEPRWGKDFQTVSTKWSGA